MRAAGVAVALALAGVALFGLLGNTALSTSEQAADRGTWSKVSQEARRAKRFAPWSAEPLRLLAVARLGEGDVVGAREMYRQAVSKDRQDWSLWFALAQTSAGANRRAALAEARRLNPRSPEIAQFVAPAPKAKR
jgi:Flp pilus assembly protein TadD